MKRAALNEEILDAFTYLSNWPHLTEETLIVKIKARKRCWRRETMKITGIINRRE